MKLMSPSDLKRIDNTSIVDYKIPSILLMEHAAMEIFNHLKSINKLNNIIIFCGGGNNGGDGLALARLLRISGDNNVKVILLTKEDKLTNDGKVYLDICINQNMDIEYICDNNKKMIFEGLDEKSIVIDAIFGTGLTREVKGIYKDVINAINHYNGYVLSVDIPSGIDGETGKVMGVAVKADITISFVFPKKGLYLYPGIIHAGEIKVVQIGIPSSVIKDSITDTYLIDNAEISNRLPRRPVRSNKGSYGKVLIIGGSKGMTGAVALAGLAAYRVGCGTVTIALPNSLVNIIETKLTEVMTYGLPDCDGHLSKQAVGAIKDIINKYDVVAIGPGIGRSTDTREILKEVLQTDKPCIIDADGLFYLEEFKNIVKNRKAATIITPHPGEMSRLTSIPVDKILENPINIAKQYSQSLNVITVLKLERIVISDTSSNIYINKHGNTGMAKGGSGDVLTGIIAGVFGQSKQAVDSVVLGCYLHGKAGDIAADKLSTYSMMPSDLIECLVVVLKDIEGNI